MNRQFVVPSQLAIRATRCSPTPDNNYLLHPMYHPSVGLRQRIRQVRQKHFGLLDLFKVKQTNDYTFGALFLEKKAVTA